jgi:hypothetical protein
MEVQGNIMKIDINMDDVTSMTALIAGLIGMIKAKSGGIIPTELMGVIKAPSQPTVHIDTDNMHGVMDSFIEGHCVYGDGKRIKSTDFRNRFNEFSKLNLSHIRFSKLMAAYNGGNIEKKQRTDGKWYEGIGWGQ